MRLKNSWVKNQGLIKLFLLIVAFSLSCCKGNKQREDAIAIVKEWTGKEIKFPENVPCYKFGKDTIPVLCDECLPNEYKILLYVDSSGCSSCRLQLFMWKQLIEEADSLFQGKACFMLFFQPKSIKEMSNLFRQYQFDYPVFIDMTNSINRLNKFPQSMQYQCFLLNSDNKVLMVGNPVLNIKIWELYKSHISDGEKIISKMNTTASIDKVEHDYGKIQKGSINVVDFTITNTGNNPLIISQITTSCGCTKVTWDKQPIEYGKTVTISVELKLDETGSLRKILTIYSNAGESPMRLTLTGTVIE